LQLIGRRAAADGILPRRENSYLFAVDVESCQSTPIVSESEQIVDRRKSRLQSRARISDRSPGWCFAVRSKDLRR
jgi:hypothetical protein